MTQPEQKRKTLHIQNLLTNPIYFRCFLHVFFFLPNILFICLSMPWRGDIVIIHLKWNHICTYVCMFESVFFPFCLPEQSYFYCFFILLLTKLKWIIAKKDNMKEKRDINRQGNGNKKPKGILKITEKNRFCLFKLTFIKSVSILIFLFSYNDEGK